MHFLHLASCEAFSLQKVVKVLEGVVGSQLIRGQVDIADILGLQRQNFVAHFIQLLKCWLCDMWLGIVEEKNWAHSVDQCKLQALLFSLHLIDLLSILLRCNGFTEIRKTVVEQRSSRLPNNDHDIFWSKFGSGKCF